MLFQRGTTHSEEMGLHEQLQGLGDFLKVMQKRIEDRMERMESKMDDQHSVTERSVEALRSSFVHHVDGVEKKEERVVAKIDARCDGVERRLEKIAHAVGIRNVVSAGDDDEDRKRLKMRLKEALTLQNEDDRVSASGSEGYLEYFFGIRPPNGRIGKQGSRFVWGVLWCALRRASIAEDLDDSIAGSSTPTHDSCKVRCSLSCVYRTYRLMKALHENASAVMAA